MCAHTYTRDIECLALQKIIHEASIRLGETIFFAEAFAVEKFTPNWVEKVCTERAVCAHFANVRLSQFIWIS